MAETGLEGKIKCEIKKMFQDKKFAGNLQIRLLEPKEFSKQKLLILAKQMKFIKPNFMMISVPVVRFHALSRVSCIKKFKKCL